MKKVGSTLSNDIQIIYTPGPKTVTKLINLSPLIPSSLVNEFLRETCEVLASGTYECRYRGAPKWVIEACLECLYK